MKHQEIAPGLRLHLLQTQKFKTNVVTILIRSPLKRETATKNALLAKMLGKCCQPFKNARLIAQECEGMFGAHLETEILKKGEEQIIQIYFEVLKDQYSSQPKENSLMERGGRLLRAIWQQPFSDGNSFDVALFEKEKAQLKRDILGEMDDKKQYAVDQCIEQMCQGEDFAVSGSGYAEDIDGITMADLVTHYHFLMECAPIEVGIVGDMDGGYCEGWVKKYFYREKAKPVVEPAVEPAYLGSPQKAAPRRKVQEIQRDMGLQQGKLVMGFRGSFQAEGSEFLQMLLFNNIFGGGSASKLFLKVREENSLCYYIHAQLYRAKQIMVVQGGIEKQNYEKVVHLVQDELKKMQDGQIIDEEMNQAKKGMCSDFMLMKDSPQRVMEFYLSNMLLGDDTTLSQIEEVVYGINKEAIVALGKNFTLDTSYFLY